MMRFVKKFHKTSLNPFGICHQGTKARRLVGSGFKFKGYPNPGAMQDSVFPGLESHGGVPKPSQPFFVPLCLRGWSVTV